MHLVHVPHLSGAGESYSSSTSVMSSPRNIHEPVSWFMRQVFLPIQPTPPYLAWALSRTGPVSEYRMIPTEPDVSARIKSGEGQQLLVHYVVVVVAPGVARYPSLAAVVAAVEYGAWVL